MNKPNQFQFEWITDWEIIYGNDFQQRWLSVYKQATEQNVFFHPALCMAWIKSYRSLRKMEPLFCIATKEDTVIFFPLVLWKRNWKNVFQHLIVPVGYSDFDYHDPLLIGLLTKEEIEQFWKEIQENLGKIHFDQFIVDGLHRKWLSGSMKLTISEKCPYIDLHNITSVEDFNRSLSSKLRLDINRRLRKLQELGKVEFKVFDENELTEAIKELIDFLKFHSLRWPHAYKAPEFHFNLIGEGLKAGVLHFSVFRIDGKSISWRLNFRNDSEYYSYMPTIHPDYQQFSPGKIHLLYCVEDAVSKGIKVYDQLRGSENYKNEWTKLSNEIYTLEWSQKTVLELGLKLIQETRNKILNSYNHNKRIFPEIAQKNLWQFEWITDWETVCSDFFWLQWQDYYFKANQSHVFLHPALGKAWIDTYRHFQHIEPLFCIARYKDITVFFPLIYWKRNWKNAFQRIIIPLGYSDFDYHDPLIIGTSKFNKDRFYSELLKKITEIKSFDKIEINGLRDKVNLKGWEKDSLFCPYYTISQFKNKEEFLNSLKTSLRGDLRRQIRKLNEKGVLSLHSYSANSVNAALAVLSHFLEIHKQRWPNAYKAPGFHKRILENGLNSGVVDFTELRIDNNPISWHLGFVDKGRYYYYMPVIQPDFAIYSPGKVHLLFLKYQSIENGIEIFDHLIGDENYKAGWTNQIQTLYCYTQKSTKRSSIIRNWVAETGKNLIK